MEISHLAFILLPIICSLILLETQAQLTYEELPNGLKSLIKPDLETWKPPKEIADKFPYYLSGFDDENRPIWVLEFGKWDILSLFVRGPKWEKLLDKHVDQWLYKMWKSLGLKADPKEEPNKEAQVIIDMDGYGLKQINSPQAVAFIVRKMRSVTLTLKFAYKAYAVNTNFVADTLFKILRPVLGKDFERLEIYGTNPAKWRPILLKTLPRTQIAEWYGGEKDFKPVWVSG